MSAGLARVLADTPIRQGYLEAQAGASTVFGPYVQAELGYRPTDPLALFALGRWSPNETFAGIGARVRF